MLVYFETFAFVQHTHFLQLAIKFLLKPHPLIILTVSEINKQLNQLHNNIM